MYLEGIFLSAASQKCCMVLLLWGGPVLFLSCSSLPPWLSPFRLDMLVSPVLSHYRRSCWCSLSHSATPVSWHSRWAHTVLLSCTFTNKALREGYAWIQDLVITSDTCFQLKMRIDFWEGDRKRRVYKWAGGKSTFIISVFLTESFEAGKISSCFEAEKIFHLCACECVCAC